MIVTQIRLLLFTAILSCAATVVESSTKSRMTVCELAKQPQKYRFQNIEVSGEIKGGLDRLLLSDRFCPNRPIALSISNDVAQKADVAPLWSAIYREGSIGTVGKHIRATVSGTFGYERGEWPKGVLSVNRVRDLEIERVQSGRGS